MTIFLKLENEVLLKRKERGKNSIRYVSELLESNYKNVNNEIIFINISLEIIIVQN